MSHEDSLATKLLVAYSDSSDCDSENDGEVQIIEDRGSVCTAPTLVGKSYGEKDGEVMIIEDQSSVSTFDTGKDSQVQMIEDRRSVCIEPTPVCTAKADRNGIVQMTENGKSGCKLDTDNKDEVQMIEDKRSLCTEPTPVYTFDGEKDGEFMITEEARSVFTFDAGKDGDVQMIEDRRSVSSFDSESDSDSSSSSSSSQSDSSSDSDALSEDDDDVLEEHDTKPAKGSFKPRNETGPKKVKGELQLEDLPPVEDLHISVPKVELLQLGDVLSILDCLVTIQTLDGLPALNIDTMLFYENGDAFGQVFDILGPVLRPLYAVRFNSKSDIVDKKISVKMPIYFAPNKQDYTTFVFVEQLNRMKGCDASWKDDSEPPEGQLDYSDDEQEKLAKSRMKGKKPHFNQDQDSLASNGETLTQKTRNKMPNQGLNRNFGPRRGRCHNQPPPSYIRTPVFRYTGNSQPATFAPNMSMQHGFPQSMSFLRYPPPPSIHHPPPARFAANIPPSYPHNQQQSNTGYQFQFPCLESNSIRPLLLSQPPPPPPSDKGTNPSVFQFTAATESEVAKTNNGTSHRSSTLLPNPFCASNVEGKSSELDSAVVNRSIPAFSLYNVSPLETNAVPMFPPSGFTPRFS